MGPAPIRDRVEVLRQWGVTKELSFFVFGVFGEGEGVVSGGTAAQDEESVADVFADLGI